MTTVAGFSAAVQVIRLVCDTASTLLMCVLPPTFLVLLKMVTNPDVTCINCHARSGWYCELRQLVHLHWKRNCTHLLQYLHASQSFQADFNIIGAMVVCQHGLCLVVVIVYEVDVLL